MSKRKILIGTSGWIYESWQNRFYPKDLKNNKLEFYSNSFNTVEINFSFYKMPTKKMFNSWYSYTPKNFKFSVKLNRYITHTKKLIIDSYSKKSINNFLNNSNNLENKLAVILIQLPSNFKINTDRLKAFITFFTQSLKRKKMKAKLAFEFRHESWFEQEIYEILEECNSTLVINDSPHFPTIKKYIGDFLYIRFHGPGMLYSSKYSEPYLKKWKNKINQLPKNIHEVYMYFNNDNFAYAIQDSLYLKSLFNK